MSQTVCLCVCNAQQNTHLLSKKIMHSPIYQNEFHGQLLITESRRNHSGFQYTFHDLSLLISTFFFQEVELSLITSLLSHSSMILL